jgi:flagellar hook-basal body complex protein FliE
MPLPIDPTLSTSGAEWKIESPGAGGAQSSGKSFGGALTQAISSLEGSQNDASAAAQSLANGSATDVSAVTMTIERARLEMQLASAIRTKAIQGFEEVFHTQV